MPNPTDFSACTRAAALSSNAQKTAPSLDKYGPFWYGLRMLIELTKGVAFLLALSLIQNFILRKWRNDELIQQIVSGLLFGGICVIGMMTPIQLSPGIIFDARSVVLSMAGLFGGPIVAGIAAAIAGGYRLWLGGIGAPTGFGVVITCTVLGLIYRHAFHKGWVTVGVIQFLLFGLIVHLATVAWFFLFPPDVLKHVLDQVVLPFIATFTPATAVLGILLADIDKRLQIERALQESENHYRSMVEYSPVCIHELDFDGRLLSMNQAGLTMLGKACERDIIGTNYLGYVADDQKDDIKNLLFLASQGESATFEFSSKEETNPRVFDSCFIPLKDSQGYIEKIMGITEDITRRKHAEDALLKSNDELEALVIERTKELSSESELLQVTLTNIRGGIVAFDAEGRLLTWNTQYSELLEVPDGFLRTGMEYVEILTSVIENGLFGEKQDTDAYVQNRLSGLKEGLTVTDERLIKGGRTIEIKRNPMPGGGQVCTYHDISARKHAEAEMAEKEVQLRAVLDNLSGGLRYVNKDKNYVFFNAQYCDLYDFPDDLLKIGESSRIENIFQAERGDFGAGNPDDLTDAWMDELPVLIEPQSWQRRTVHGKILQVNSTPTPSGGVINIVTDITERRRAEEELKDSHERQRLIFESSPYGVSVVATSDTNIRLYVNQRMVEIFGADSAEQMLGHSPFDSYVDMEISARLAKVTDDGSFLTDAEVERIRLDGSKWWCQLHRRAICFEGTDAIVTWHADITDRKRAEKAVQLAREAAERANRSKSNFLATMSHELRTPLNAILGFSSMIKDQVVGSKGRGVYEEYGADIYNSGHHLLKLINDLLDISKIEANKTQLNLEQLDVRAMVLKLFDTIEPLALDARIKINAELDDNLQPITADARAIDQILLNLLSNAIKFTPAGGKVIVSGTSDGTYTTLIITDTGTGIEAERIGSVLEPWEQASNPMSAKSKGFGLGLPIVKSLTDLHGGTLTLQSIVGEGTTVSVSLPNAGPLHPITDTGMTIC